MNSLNFENIYLENRWQQNQKVDFDDTGVITNITPTTTPNESRNTIDGYAIPSFINSHSHSFQYAMAGLAECVSPKARNDDFWTWRNQMYELALSVTPERLEEITTNLYKRMRANGYTHVIEFHYLHHSQDGSSYPAIAELSNRIIQASLNAKIDLTIVPVLYQFGNFNTPASSEQRRFIFREHENYLRLLDELTKNIGDLPSVKLGAGIHSLRAAIGKQVSDVFNYNASLPFHIHIAEQTKEVSDCQANFGKHPIDLLSEFIEFNERVNLVHATHIEQTHVQKISKSGSTVVLCPTTEANLGDGIFPLIDYLNANGSFSIGSDSHIGLSPLEELRWLDYAQRLIHRKRNLLLADNNIGYSDSGTLLFDTCQRGGRRSAGLFGSEAFSVGQPLNAIVLDSASPLFADKPAEKAISTLIYGGDTSNIGKLLYRGKFD